MHSAITLAGKLEAPAVVMANPCPALRTRVTLSSTMVTMRSIRQSPRERCLDVAAIRHARRIVLVWIACDCATAVLYKPSDEVIGVGRDDTHASRSDIEQVFRRFRGIGEASCSLAGCAEKEHAPTRRQASCELDGERAPGQPGADYGNVKGVGHASVLPGRPSAPSIRRASA